MSKPIDTSADVAELISFMEGVSFRRTHGDLPSEIVRALAAERDSLRAKLAESHPSAVDIQSFGYETNEPWPGQQPTANALAEAIAEMATNDRWGLIQRVRAIIVRDRATVRARWEKHPSAIREAVEREREACAKLVAAHGIAGMPFDVGSWTPGAVAAAIRARGEG